jgi:hypothetical protein
MAAALAALSACAFVDLGAVSAQWNVRHAPEVGGRGAALDLCYMNRLGASALVSLAELESRPLPAELRERAAWLRNLILDELEPAQSDWRGWTFRNHRRLARTRAIMAERRLPRFTADSRLCDGRPWPVEPPTAAPPLDSTRGGM